MLAANGGARDYDEGVYWQSLRALTSGHQLFSQIFAPQGPVFFYGLLPLYTLLGHSIGAARIGVAVFELVAAAAIYVAAARLAGAWAGLAAVVLLLSDPIWAMEALTLHAEVPALALGLVAIALIVVAIAPRASGSATAWWCAASGAALALGTATKAFVLVFAIPIGLLILVSELSNRWRRLAITIGGFVLAAFVVFLPYLAHLRQVYADLVTSHLSAGHAIGHGLRANLQLLHLGRELPLEVAAAVAIVVLLAGRDRLAVPALAWIVATLAALLVYQPLFPHEVALLTPPLAFTAAIGSSRAVGLINAASRAPGMVMAAGIVAVIALLASSRDLAGARAAGQPNPHGEALAAAISSHTDPHDLVIGDNPYAIALADRDTPAPLVDTSYARIGGGTLTTGSIEAIAVQEQVRMFVFDTGRLDGAAGLRQWVAGRYPQVVTVDGGTLYFIPR